jgi:ABC-type lipoprotein release transport system permease subunit
MLEPRQPGRAFASFHLLLFLAVRSLTQSRLISALLIGAVTGGVSCQIPNTANLLGYDAQILEHGVVAGFGDVRVRPRKGHTFEDGDAVAERLRPLPGVVAAIPILMVPGAVSHGSNFHGAIVIGVDPAASHLPYRIERGKNLAPGDRKGALVGGAIAGRIGNDVGSRIILRAFFGPDLGAGANSGRFALNVTGITEGSFIAYESVTVDRAFLAVETGEEKSATMILVHIQDHQAARSLARAIEAAHPDLRALAWLDDTPLLSRTLDGSAAVGGISRTMVVIGVLFPVWALMYVHVLHRRREIGVLSALGLRRGEVFLVFFFQALLIGVTGLCFGALIGYGVTAYFDAHPIFALGAFIIRPVLTVRTFVEPMGLVLAATLLAGSWPAWRAARIAPSQVIRGEE